MSFPALTSVAQVRNALGGQSYLADEGLATAVFLALSLKRPLLLEGEAGVGKTELAKVIAAMTGGELIRLQCYEGIDASQAVYDWDYSRQLLHLRAAEASGEAMSKNTSLLESELYNERFLIKRALLRAIDNRTTPAVLLIDEIDRADDEFEAYLLEILSDFQITVPELGTFSATSPPIVVLTSNRTRDVHDALLAALEVALRPAVRSLRRQQASKSSPTSDRPFVKTDNPTKQAVDLSQLAFCFC